MACRSECTDAVVKTIDAPVTTNVASRIAGQPNAGRPGAQRTRSVEWRRAARMRTGVGRNVGTVSAVPRTSGGGCSDRVPLAALS